MEYIYKVVYKYEVPCYYLLLFKISHTISEKGPKSITWNNLYHFKYYWQNLKNGGRTFISHCFNGIKKYIRLHNVVGLGTVFVSCEQFEIMNMDPVFLLRSQFHFNTLNLFIPISITSTHFNAYCLMVNEVRWGAWVALEEYKEGIFFCLCSFTFPWLFFRTQCHKSRSRCILIFLSTWIFLFIFFFYF